MAATDGGGSSSTSRGPGGPLTPPLPPHAIAQSASCTKVLEQLPVQLDKLMPRIVRTQFVVAWGNPAVVLSCGTARPKSLHPGSGTQYFQNGTIATGPFFDVTQGHDGNVFTTVDRVVYVSISVPRTYQGSTVVPPLSDAIAKALPPVCGVPDNNGRLTMRPACTERSS